MDKIPMKPFLQKGEALNFPLTRPISSELVQKLKNIYTKCYSSNKIRLFGGNPLILPFEDHPLIVASELGLHRMVWGFIECAKQTDTNLHTRETGKLQEFLGYTTKSGNTALHVAAIAKHDDVIELLVRNVSLEHLISYRNNMGQTPVSILCEWDFKYDKIIFEAMEAEIAMEAATIISIDDDEQESKVYNDSIMDPNSYPISHLTETRESLEKLDQGQLELTANKSTILHLVAEFGDVKYVTDILQKHPSLARMRNSEGETAAYVAAQEGHADVVAIMIKHFEVQKYEIELLLTRSTDKQTALHIAIQHHHIGVVFLLIKEVPRLANYINNFGESSLYLATERRYDAILKLMHDKCIEKSFDGPNGKTALHAAAITGSKECIDLLLSANDGQLHVQDNNGWTPLHYAIYHEHPQVTRALLLKDKSIGYERGAKDGISAIHIAASRGQCETLTTLISLCHGCFKLTDNKGRNCFHVAVENKKTEVIEYILQHKSGTSLINQQDSNGNTPIHLLMASDLQTMDMIMDSRININVLNNEKLTPLDVASTDEKREKLLQGITMNTSRKRFLCTMLHDTRETRVLPATLNDIETRVLPSALNNIEVLPFASNNIEVVPPASNNIEKKVLPRDTFGEELKSTYMVVEGIVLVAALIATTTFAAAFTVPGGVDGDQGTPILLRRAAFVTFVITNTIAFSCSASVLFGHVVLLFYRLDEDNLDEDTGDHIFTRSLLMYCLTGLAMLAMTIAFVTGMYVTLTPSHGLAIFSSTMSLFIIALTLVFPSKIGDFLRSVVAKVIEKM